MCVSVWRVRSKQIIELALDKLMNQLLLTQKPQRREMLTQIIEVIAELSTNLPKTVCCINMTTCAFACAGGASGWTRMDSVNYRKA